MIKVVIGISISVGHIFVFMFMFVSFQEIGNCISAANMPVVRNRAVFHTMDWCKCNTDQLCDETFFPIIHDLVLLSATDVWSAIRNACAGRLAHVAANLTLDSMRTLFYSFVKV